MYKKHTPSIPKYLLPLIFTPTLTIHFIKKAKVMRKSNIYLNYIIFDFFVTLIFLIRRIIKVDVKVKDDKHLGMDRVPIRKLIQKSYSFCVSSNEIFNQMLLFNLF
jgi:hypothetical protein